MDIARGAAVERRREMTFDECWSILQEGAINKLIRIVEADEKHPNRESFTGDEYMRFYTLVYNFCTSGRSEQTQEIDRKKLYEQYKRTFEDYILSKVLPSLKEKSNENLLKEFLRRWRNHKAMTKVLSRFLLYLERYYIYKWSLPSLVEASYSIFCNLVYVEVKDQVCDTITSLIVKEQIDEATVKEVLDFCEDIRSVDPWENCAKDMEEAITASRFKYLRL